MSRKGIQISIKFVLILVVGIIVVASFMGVWSTIEQDTNSSVDESLDENDEEMGDSDKVTDCRSQHPGGGGAYQECLSN